MYPNLQYIAQALFEKPMPGWLSFINTFGLLVAIAFMVASSVLVAELKRKEKNGLLAPQEEVNKDGTVKLTYPHQRASNIVLLAMFSGIIGAKVFNAFETWENFLKDPIGNLFSGGGLTFYGGLLVGGAVLFFYTRRHKIDIRHFADSIAPSLMLAYGIGRLGCHFSGDGDWGIFNSAYTTLADGTLSEGDMSKFDKAFATHSKYFTANFDSLTAVPHIYTPAPTGLPAWFVAYSYKHNVINEGFRLPTCMGDYCHVLPVSVFPTALYEALICILLFGLMWAIRKRFTIPLHFFGVYLILNGAERFIIEKFRVNYKYDWGFLHPTQAEIISSLLVLTGISLLLFYKPSEKITLNV